MIDRAVQPYPGVAEFTPGVQEAAARALRAQGYALGASSGPWTWDSTAGSSHDIEERGVTTSRTPDQFRPRTVFSANTKSL